MKKENIKINKLKAANLHSVLSSARSSSLSRDVKLKLIMLRSKLSPYATERDNIIADVRKHATKEEFDTLVSTALQKFSEEIIDLDTRVLSEDDVFALMDCNDFPGASEDLLHEFLIK